MRIEVPVSVGELIDKITILEIKQERILNPGTDARHLLHDCEAEERHGVWVVAAFVTHEQLAATQAVCGRHHPTRELAVAAAVHHHPAQRIVGAGVEAAADDNQRGAEFLQCRDHHLVEGGLVGADA